MIPDWVEASILHHAEREAPNECCGLVARGDEEYRVYRAQNIAEDPATAFLLDPHDQFRLLNEIGERELTLLAIYHSHPNGSQTPSERDLEFAARWPGLTQLIAADGEVRAYTASGRPL